MSATYSTSLDNDISKIRFWIRDTDITDPRYTDEEINGVLALCSDWIDAAIELLHRDQTSAALEAGILKLGQFGSDQSEVSSAIAKTIDDLIAHHLDRYTAVENTVTVFERESADDESVGNMNPW